jgi:hypothetical protein
VSKNEGSGWQQSVKITSATNQTKEEKDDPFTGRKEKDP